MRKGITPIISIIILLLITVALAAAAWTFLQGFFFPQITKTFAIPKGGDYCSSGVIKIYLLNTGYQSTLEKADIILADIDGNSVLDNGLTDFSIPTGKTDLAVEYDCVNNDPSACSGDPLDLYSGYHAVDLGTNSKVEHLSIYCP
jgi:flagellin-like protein